MIFTVMKPQTLIELSQSFLLAVRKGEIGEESIKSLENSTKGQLFNELTTDALRITFWVNCYNAYTLYFLQQTPTLVHSFFSRGVHFTQRKITIASQKLSLDEIEHGILRGLKWSAFHQMINVFWKTDFIEKAVVLKPDPRIHFALNCGGKSCPPVRFYEEDKLDEQLESATRNFLSSEAIYVQSANTLLLSKLFKWYCTDFGGKEGMIDFLKERKILPKDASPLVRYSSYEW